MSIDVVKPLQSMQLVTDDGKPASPSDPFVMAILVRQKSFNFGSIILNKMGEKSEQFTRDSSVVCCGCCLSGCSVLRCALHRACPL